MNTPSTPVVVSERIRDLEALDVPKLRFWVLLEVREDLREP